MTNNPRNTDPQRVHTRIQEVLMKRGVLREQSEKITDAIERVGVPDAFTFRGIELRHPFGRAEELVKGRRLERLNEALEANHNKPIKPQHATVAECTKAYNALWHKTRQPEYDPTPVPPKPVVEHVFSRHDRTQLQRLDAAIAALTQEDA